MLKTHNNTCSITITNTIP